MWVIEKAPKSVRIKLMATFGVCLLVSIIIFNISEEMFSSTNSHAVLSYEDGIERIRQTSLEVHQSLQKSSQEELTFDDENFKNNAEDNVKYYDTEQNREILQKKFDEKVSELIENDNSLKIFITDENGNILFKTSNVPETQINLHKVLFNKIKAQLENENTNKEFYAVREIKFANLNGYVVVSGIPEPQIRYIYGDSSSGPLPTVLSFATFILLFLFLTKKKIKYIEILSNGLLEISTGNLGHRVEINSNDELGQLANNINFMAEELKTKIESERKAEQMKNELITNVSHDLRTPLTTVMGYLRLIKDKKYQNEEQLKEYTEVAYEKSDKLKNLIENLFEFTKLSNNGITLNKREVCINELLEQLIEELIPISEENKLEFLKDISHEKIMVNIDPDKMVRVFENILMNAIRYSYKPGEIKVKLFKESNKVIILVQNKGDNIPQEEIPNLFERFYRVEKSRSMDTGGSGLGLAIAKSIINLHDGEIWAECDGNEITFGVKLTV